MRQSRKFVTALVKPFKLDVVVEVLARIGVHELTVTEAKIYGGERGSTEIYRGAVYTPDFVSMIKLELAVSSEKVGKVRDSIVRAASLGTKGDVRVFVFDLDEAAGRPVGETDVTTPLKAA